MTTANTIASAITIAIAFAAPAFAGGPVRVAVAGVAGDASPAELAKLSTDLRAAVASRADAGVFSVVTPDEMARAYAAHGPVCAADDVVCLRAASSAWDGRLFVHGTLKRGDDGITLTLAIDSAKGLHVAHTSIDADNVAALTKVLPLVAGELFEKERVFRARMTSSQPQVQDVVAPPVVVQDVVTPTVPVAQSEPYVCRDANANGLSIGTLTLDDDGVTYQSTNGFAQHWHHRWSELKVANPYFAFMQLQHAILLQANDVLDVRWFDAGVRDRCVNELQRRWYAHR